MLIVKAWVWVTLILLTSWSLSSQIQISDDFSDGDHSTNPLWVGDTGFYKVTAVGELQLLDSLAGSRSLSTASTISMQASWEWSCRLQFNPSSSNYLRVYLLSNRQDVDGTTEGYFLNIGGDSEDVLSLYRQDPTQSTLLGKSSAGWVDRSLVNINIKVTRDQNYNWSVFADTTGAGSMQLAFTARDSMWLASTYFGLSPRYTKTRSDRFYFDDFVISGYPYIDSIPPEITNILVLDSVILQLVFNETVDSASVLETSNYNISKGISLTSLRLEASDTVEIALSSGLIPNEEYSLSMSQIKDLFGNEMDSVLKFRYVILRAGDIVINELMVDPSPSVGIPPFDLPEAEFIELHNLLPWKLRLTDWKLMIGMKEHQLRTMDMDSLGYLVLANQDVLGDFGDSLPVLPLNISSTALINSGSLVQLLDNSGRVISAVNYDEDYYQNKLKAQGGWSIERINPRIGCDDSSNWSASEDRNGGTPGRENSLDSSDYDKAAAQLKSLDLNNRNSLTVNFTKAIRGEDSIFLSLLRTVPQLNIREYAWAPDNPATLRLDFYEELNYGQVYRIVLKEGWKACNGSISLMDSMQFGLPEMPEFGDIIINEVLFNPKPEGVDFVEFRNVSDKIIDVSSLVIGNWDSISMSVVNRTSLASTNGLIFPDQYFTLSESIESLEMNYPSSSGKKNLLTQDLPSLPDDKGSIAVQSSALILIDQFSYNEDMHHPALSTVEGVSLERINPNVGSELPENWHSASSSVGYATPGYKNSQNRSQMGTENLRVWPKVFTPNMDGYNDILSIEYSSSKAALIGKLSIWTYRGTLVKVLSEQTLLGQNEVFYWDGSNSEGILQNPGIYIVVMETYGPDEKRRVQRKTCALSP